MNFLYIFLLLYTGKLTFAASCSDVTATNIDEINEIQINCTCVDILRLNSIQQEYLTINACANIIYVVGGSMKYINFTLPLKSSIFLNTLPNLTNVTVLSPNISQFVISNVHDIQQLSLGSSVIDILFVTNCTWSNLNVFRNYPVLSMLILMKLPFVTDLSPITSSLSEISMLQLQELPLLPTLSSLKSLKRIDSIILSQLPLITSLDGLGSLNTLQSLQVTDLPKLSDIESLRNIISPISQVSFTGVSPCLPDSSTGLYEKINSNAFVNFRNCHTFGTCSPVLIPVEGGVDINIKYSGSFRYDSMYVDFGSLNSQCHKDVQKKIWICPVPSSQSVSGRIVLQPVGCVLEYARWQDYVKPLETVAKSRIEITESASPIEDNKTQVSIIVTSIWSVMFFFTLFLAIFTYLGWWPLPLSLDVLRSPVYINTEDGKVITANSRTPVGVFLNLTCLLAIISVVISCLVPFFLDNTWSLDTLVLARKVHDAHNFAIRIQVLPSPTYCDTNRFILSHKGFDDVFWSANVTEDNVCTISMQCDACKFDDVDTGMTVSLNSPQFYAYTFKYYIDSWGTTSSLDTHVNGIVSTNNASLIFKGESYTTVAFTVTPVNIKGNMAGSGIRMDHLYTNKGSQILLQDFARVQGLGISIQFKPSDYWLDIYVRDSQGTVEVLAKIFALVSGCVTITRIIVLLVAKYRNRSIKTADISLSTRNLNNV